MRVCCVATGPYAEHDYAGKLYRGLKRFTTADFNFICTTESDLPGWWAKMEFFNPMERTIVLDADVVITGDCDFLFQYDGRFCLRVNEWNPKKWDTSVMSIAPGYGGELKERFYAASKMWMKEYRSDQDYLNLWIRHADVWQKVAPRKTQSYKINRLESGSGDASLVHFHGEPKPADLPDSHWAREYWI